MGAFLAIGEQLVDHEALQDQLARGRWQDFERDINAGKDAHIEVGDRSVGRVDVEFSPPMAGATATETETPQFTAIGIGQPLSIEIFAMYTGDGPGRRPRDVLAVSGVKSVETHEAAPRAVNQLVNEVSSRQLLVPAAFGTGSPVVYYSPALLNDTVLVSFELVADRFDDSLLEKVRSLFNTASGLPIFAPSSSVLMAGSFVLGAVGTLGKALFETEPFLRADIPLRFDTPGFPMSLARHMVLCNDRNFGELSRFRIGINQAMGRWKVELVDDGGRAYRGDAPYMIASFDGRQRNSLKEFTPTLASAAVLEQFYRAGDVAGTAIGVLREALTLYNDHEFSGKAAELARELATMPAGDPRLEEIRKLVEAYNKNIRTDELKIEIPG
jgi:hypothetical protein